VHCNSDGKKNLLKRRSWLTETEKRKGVTSLWN